MNAASSTNDPGRDDAVMRELLLLADRQEIQPPGDVLDSVRARLHENTVPSPSAAPRRAARGTWRAVGIGAAAAVVALIALFFWMQPSSTAWSQVVQSVRAMPWIHAKAVGSKGNSQESWASFSRNIGALRTDDMVRYDDFRSGIRYEYDPQKKKLFRLSTSGEVQFKSEEGLFHAIFRGDATLGDNLLGQPIVQQRQRTVDEQGRRWILYELEFADPDSRDLGKTTSVAIRVDPQTKLPDSMTFTRGDEKWQTTIDYPDEGPADIYALGVPRDAPVDDRTPPPDLDRILKIVQQNRRDFGDYLAVAGGDNSDRRFAVHLIRCKGDQCRIDIGLGDTSHVASAADMEQWWREHGKDTLPVGSVLCDGRRVYQRTFAGPEPEWELSNSPIQQTGGRAAAARIGRVAKYFVDLKAYPSTLSPEELASTPFLTVHLDPTGENGPAGTVRVERLVTATGAAAVQSTDKEEFWLQPEYGYAVVQYAISLSPAAQQDSLPKPDQWIWKHEAFRQTPSGVWYPTVIRWQNIPQSAGKNKPAGIEVEDQVTYFHLDFAAELPDELFSPGWQGNLLGGITFPQGADLLTTSDLGKIRPPGGVPLICSRSVLTPEVLSRVSRRLEAAPGKDLDQWVAELERIMGKRVDSWTDRQGCRTSFVTRMSVAFDGFRWNSQAADILFQRARSLPPSEAGAWKEALETLLSEKIEPAFELPLVLIPMDALYEGQNYSADRARKYLARLKQLTAGDVSLWKDEVDQFGGRNLDAAINIVLLDDYFEKEQFQRKKFHAAIEKKKVPATK